jgi:hypothetical protein
MLSIFWLEFPLCLPYFAAVGEDNKRHNKCSSSALGTLEHAIS